MEAGWISDRSMNRRCGMLFPLQPWSSCQVPSELKRISILGIPYLSKSPTAAPTNLHVPTSSSSGPVGFFPQPNMVPVMTMDTVIRNFENMQLSPLQLAEIEERSKSTVYPFSSNNFVSTSTKRDQARSRARTRYALFLFQRLQIPLRSLDRGSVTRVPL